MKKFLILLFALLPLCVSAKEYRLKFQNDIVGVDNSSVADVEMIYSPAQAGTVICDRTDNPLDVSVNRGGMVIIKSGGKMSMRKISQIPRVRIYYGKGFISKIINSGTGDVKLREVNSPGELSIVNSGTGDVEINRVKLKKLAITNSGTGDVEIEGGKTVTLRICNSGTGDVKAKVNSSDCEIRNNGTGDVEDVYNATNKMYLENCGCGKIEVLKTRNGCQWTVNAGCNRNIKLKK